MAQDVAEQAIVVLHDRGDSTAANAEDEEADAASVKELGDQDVGFLDGCEVVAFAQAWLIQSDGVEQTDVVTASLLVGENDVV